MISARTQHKSGMAMVQYPLFPELSGDCRLLVPGWAGELNPTELEFVLDQLNRDRQLARLWGFRSSARRRSEPAVRELALAGHPAHGSANVDIARQTAEKGEGFGNDPRL